MAWNHDDLAEDLAGYLRGNSERFVWTDMQLGPAGSPRPDVYTLQKSYSHWMPLAYECKVSKSDFRADVTAGKWQSYLKFAGAVIFGSPVGLIDASDIPHGCGLMHRTEKQWKTVKRPTLRQLDNLPKDTWMKIILDGRSRVGPAPINTNRGSIISSYIHTDAVRKKFGKAIADLLSNRQSAEHAFEAHTEQLKMAAEDALKQYHKIIAQARDKAELETAEINDIRRDLCEALGAPLDSSARTLRRQATFQLNNLRCDVEIKRLTYILHTVRQSLSTIEMQVPEIAKTDSPMEDESVK